MNSSRDAAGFVRFRRECRQPETLESALASRAPAPLQQPLLLTGDRGLIGRWLRRALEKDGWQVRGFDIRDGHDVCDAAAVRKATAGTSVTIHCAALPHDSAGHPSEVLRVNRDGGENVLAAAEAAGHDRVIIFSSAQVFGIFDGESAPVSFPITDASPRLAARPYGAAKVALEDACEAFSARTGIATLCLRPVHVLVPGEAADTRRRWRAQPSREWTPFWNFGAFVDMRDVVAAVRLALDAPLTGHARAILCAQDAAVTRPTVSLSDRFYPSTPWGAGLRPGAESTAAVFEASEALRVMGWSPRHSWAETSRETLLHRFARRLRQPFPP